MSSRDVRPKRQTASQTDDVVIAMAIANRDTFARQSRCHRPRRRIQGRRKTPCYNRRMAIEARGLAALSDDHLVGELKRLVRNECAATAALIRGLMELDRRPHIYLGHGCSSLYSYCTQVLGLSADAAYTRIEIARAATVCPALVEALEDDRLSLTAARLLAPHVDGATGDPLIAAASGRTKLQVRTLLASLYEGGSTDTANVALPPATSTPVAADRMLVQVTLPRATYDKIIGARDLLFHVQPHAEVAFILDRALDALHRELARRRFAATSSPRPQPERRRNTRHVPAQVKRDVKKRDGNRCAFVGAGGRCTETAGLQFHHKIRFCDGGEATVDNIELRCPAHNRYEETLFVELMDDAVGMEPAE